VINGQRATVEATAKHNGDRPGGSLRQRTRAPGEARPAAIAHGEFPRCEHYLQRAFEGLDPRRFGTAAGVPSLRGRSQGETFVGLGLRGKRYGEGEARPVLGARLG
jgi:hypothetical protein